MAASTSVAVSRLLDGYRGVVTTTPSAAVLDAAPGGVFPGWQGHETCQIPP